MRKRILIVDGDRNFAKTLKYDLTESEYIIKKIFFGKECMAELRANDYDLVILDLELPDKSGLALCQSIRKESTIPIIVISAKDTDLDIILSLESGADDYLIKPFNILELKARIEAIFRRMGYSDNAAMEEEYHIGEFTINPIGRTIEIKGQEINLTGKEFDLFYILIKNAGQVFSREELLDIVWGEDHYGDGRTIDVHIRRIRRKLGRVTDESTYILTQWGVGYYFDPLRA